MLIGLFPGAVLASDIQTVEPLNDSAVTVTTEQELRDAINNVDIPEIIVNNTITISGTIRIPNNRTVTIIGNGTILAEWTSGTDAVHFRMDRGMLTLRGNLTLTRAPGMIVAGRPIGGIGIHGSDNATATEAVLNIHDNVTIIDNAAGQQLGGGAPQVVRMSMGGGMWVMNGTVNMYGGEISDNSARAGGGVFLGGSSVFNMFDGLIYDNTATEHGGGIDINSSTFNMNGGTIDDNSAGWDGGGVMMRSGSATQSAVPVSVMNMHDDAEIINNTARDGGGIAIWNYSVFYIHDGLIAGNSATRHGGGIYSEMGVITMEDGVIYDNRASNNGGGVMALNFHPFATVNTGIFTMNGGDIIANQAQNGGGVQVWQGGRFILDGGHVNDNRSRGGGGGVFANLQRSQPVIPTATGFTMYDGEISGNRNLYSGGGGGVLLLNTDGAFYMHGGLIYDNEAFTNGGGVNVSGGSFVMYDGIIENNYAPQNGGGVIVGTDATFTAHAGSIIDNHAVQDGGGIFTLVYEYARTLSAGAFANVTTSEDVVFADNTAGNGSFMPPVNWDITAIGGDGASPATVSHQAHQLNNYDVNFNYTRQSIPVTFVLDGGYMDNDPANTADVVRDIIQDYSITEANVPVPTRAGRTFLGWRENNTGETIDRTTVGGHVITAPRSYTAQWSETIEATVTYVPGDGIGVPHEVRVWAATHTLLNTDVTNFMPQEGYVFIGWIVEGGDGELLQPGDQVPVTSGMVFVAQWRAVSVAPSFTLTYLAGTNGIGGPHVAAGVRAGSHALLALSEADITAQEGYRFIGWQIEGETALRQPGEAIIVDRDLTIVAQWETIMPDSRIDKTADRRVTLIGSQVGYTITVTNEGAVPMANYEVIDELDTRFVEFVEGSLRVDGAECPSATHTSGTIHVALDQLAPGESVVITFRVTVLDVAVGETVYNTAVLRHQIYGDISASEAVQISVLYIRPNPTHHAYLVGFPDGTVQPRSDISRAEVATIFFRLICDEFRSEIWSQDNPFSDVALRQWFNSSISTMANDGLLLGYPDGTFRPNDAITRAEFATIVSRFLNLAYAGGNRFSDTDGHWATAAINTVAYVGWVTGYPDGTFRPDNPITRAEAATIVNRIFHRNLSEVDYSLDLLITWPDNDNPNAWYYLHMKEATNSNYYEMLECGFYKAWTVLFQPRDWTVLQRPDSRPEDIR